VASHDTGLLGFRDRRSRNHRGRLARTRSAEAISVGALGRSFELSENPQDVRSVRGRRPRVKRLSGVGTEPGLTLSALFSAEVVWL
jgi:hypothetical protein